MYDDKMVLSAQNQSHIFSESASIYGESLHLC